MTCVLLISVRFHDGRYHGKTRERGDEWPPSPARVFQALVAGAARGSLRNTDNAALKWLESLDDAPIIAAPQERPGQSYAHYLPNNDLDAVGGDVRKMGRIRSAVKQMRPRIFDATVPLLYAWAYETDDVSEVRAKAVVQLANRLYQLGRGVDMAWAAGEVIDLAEFERRLAAYPGAIHRPCSSGDGVAFDCPQPDSLKSLCERHKAGGHRFMPTEQGTLLFAQAPRPRFRSVLYNSPTVHMLFDLRDTARSDLHFASWPSTQVFELTQKLRGSVDPEGVPQSGAAWKLWDKLADKRGEISIALIGRNATEADKQRRVRIVPLPSIGHVHVNRDIRRVLVEVPPSCPLRVDDVAWAFSGLEVASSVDVVTGELASSIRLMRATDHSMLAHYGVGSGQASRLWRSVTPLALPADIRRHRTELARLRAGAKGGSVRLTEHQKAAGAVLHALRHAGVRAAATRVQVQREPFEARGSRAEQFSPDTRFAKERLWHAEITFATSVQGPLMLGDGRYVGLGLMRPVESIIGLHAFRIAGGLANGAEPATISTALRRAVMARVQDSLGARGVLPTFFTGHEHDGMPAREDGHRHLAFVTDLVRGRLLIVAPHIMEHRNPTRDEVRNLTTLAASLVGLAELRAGAAGRLQLTPSFVCADDPLLAATLRWESVTEYRVTRHLKMGTAHDALSADVTLELSRRNLPRPKRIEIIQCASGPRSGIAGRMRIEFETAIRGPILIGRTCHSGGGLFEVAAPLNHAEGVRTHG